MRLDELRKLAEAAAVEAEGDWFCPDLLENDMPIVSTTKAKRFMHAASPAAVLQLIAVAEAAKKAGDALDAASSAIVAGICFHENTHRGGFLWTICDDCGQKWADDRGGFQKAKMPKEYLQATEAAASLRAALAALEKLEQR